MHVHGFCPQCNTEISRERHQTGAPICQCGWYDRTPAIKAHQEAEKKTSAILVFFAVAITLLFGHMLNWGGYAFSIPFVKLQQITGTLSKEGYQELAKACIELNKWSCAQNAYLDLYKKTRDPEGLAGLAHFQVRLKEKDAAMKTYASYFQVGGQSGDAALEYAHLLEDSGNTQAALQYFEASIQYRPQILPVHATTAIVRMMMKQGRYDEAYQRILDFHASAGNAKGYLNTELTQLEEYMKKNGKKVATRS